MKTCARCGEWSAAQLCEWCAGPTVARVFTSFDPCQARNRDGTECWSLGAVAVNVAGRLVWMCAEHSRIAEGGST